MRKSVLFLFGFIAVLLVGTLVIQKGWGPKINRKSNRVDHKIIVKNLDYGPVYPSQLGVGQGRGWSAPGEVSAAAEREKITLNGKVAFESQVARAGLCKVSKFLVKLRWELQGGEGGASAYLPTPWPPAPPRRTPNYHMFVMAEPKGIKIDFEAAFTVHFIYIWVFFSSH